MDSIVKNYTIDDLLSGDPTYQTEAAFFLVNKKILKDEIFKLLESGNREIASYAVTQLDKVETQKEALILTRCLKYEDSRITDPASTLIKNIVINPELRSLFFQQEILDILIGYISASNPRVCKNIAEILFFIGCTSETAKRIVRICFQELNGDNYFTLYWSLFSLERVISSLNNFNDTDILRLLKIISVSQEYQLRERAALLTNILIVKKSDPELDEIRKKFQNDDNFYVKNIAK